MANLITIVFTDLVDSTGVKAEMPGRDIAARNHACIERILQPHRQRVRGIGEKYGMHVVKTEGDAYFVVFDNPSQAAQCAAEIQDSHREHPIETGTAYGNVRVKIGMHTGAPPPDPDDPNDYVGEEVDYASRVAALANGGQITLSEATTVFVRDAHITDFAVHPHVNVN